MKILKWIGISIASILFFMFIIPILFPGKVSEQVKLFANKHLAGELDYKKTHLTFFRHFPSLTVSVDDFLLKGSKPFQNDTLLAAKEVAVGINLKNLIFDGEVKIDEIYVTDAYANVFVNTKGEANYNVYVSKPSEKPKDTISTGASIKLDLIKLRNWNVKYNDHAARVLVDAKGLNYTGKGGLSEDIFDLETDLDIDKLDFSLNRIYYAKQKTLHADLITRINTNALTFVLRKNELRINDLPLKFTGFVSILKDGYNLDINAASEKTTIRDMISVLPPQYLDWAKDTKIEGKSDLFFSLKGRFSEPQNQKPRLKARLMLKDGFVSNGKAPVPMNNFNMDLNVDLPDLDTEKLGVDLKNLNFDLGPNNNFKAVVKTKGLDEMQINADVKGAVNLQTLTQALGLKDIDARGLMDTNIKANGIFSLDKKLFPKTNGYLNLKNGWLKTKYYPNPIQNINIVANIINTDGTFKSLGVKLDPFKFDFEGNPVFVNADLQNFEDVLYKVRAKGTLNVGRIYKVFAKKGLDVSGLIMADLSLNGRQSYATTGQYSRLDNRGNLILKNIKATTAYLPKSFYIKEGNFEFENEKMWFRKFFANYGKSDFALNGYLLNTINYFIERKGTLHGKFKLKSRYILIDEFMALKDGDNSKKSIEVDYAKVENPKSSGVVIIPKNLDVSLEADAKNVEFKGLNLNNLFGLASVNKGEVFLKNTSFDVVGSRMKIDARYQDESPLTANYDIALNVLDFDVQRAYNEIDMVREMATAAKNVKGIVSLDYKLKGDFDKNMTPIYPSLEGGGVVNLRDVEVKNLKMLSAVGDNIGAKAFNNPDMKGVNIETHIKNNLIHVDKFTFKVSILRPTISGTTSFNGLLDLRVRVGILPGGLIGFPIVVTGTHEKPQVKIFSKKGQGIVDALYNEKSNKVIREERRAEKKTKRQQRKEKEAQEQKAKNAEKQVSKDLKEK
ncbi:MULTISPECIES: AsmA-like C-terminal region-containing protein [Chryseobacterium]|uniref:AsmA-like C-terminal region-containing protein n=1 Tax=Chryseobacterium TaxID=59732 RepID=UPI001EF97C6A|nr:MULTISPECIES: AsmA-like C-terminal region-containing protein [Chryseobacterium]MBM7420299.1 AsmA protein [Chryseobacterium sp. JUb44]WSO08957.1 AsmA-like C-terminal region-containing protein [Chryseobacterium scophthalmum]